MTFSSRYTTTGYGGPQSAVVYDVYKVPNATGVPVAFCEPMYDAKMAPPWNYTLEPGWIDATPTYTYPSHGMAVNEQGVFISANQLIEYDAYLRKYIWHNELLFAPASGTNWTVYQLQPMSGPRPYDLSWRDTWTNMYDYYGVLSMHATSTDVFFMWTHAWNNFTPPYQHAHLEFRAFSISTGVRVIDTDQVSKQVFWARGQELLWYIRDGSDVHFWYTNDNCVTFNMIATFTTVAGSQDFHDSGLITTDVYFREVNGAIAGALKLSGGVLTQETIT
jgi:hypothetical protein